MKHEYRFLYAAMLCFAAAIICSLFVGCYNPDCVTTETNLYIYNSEVKNRPGTDCENLDPWVLCLIDILPKYADVERDCLYESLLFHFFVRLRSDPVYVVEFNGYVDGGVYWGSHAEVIWPEGAAIESTAFLHELIHRMLHFCGVEDEKHSHQVWESIGEINDRCFLLTRKTYIYYTQEIKL